MVLNPPNAATLMWWPPTIKNISLPLHDCTFGTVTNRNVIPDMQGIWHRTPKGGETHGLRITVLGTSVDIFLLEPLVTSPELILGSGFILFYLQTNKQKLLKRDQDRVKNPDCSFTGPGFSSQHTHGTSSSRGFATEGSNRLTQTLPGERLYTD